MTHEKKISGSANVPSCERRGLFASRQEARNRMVDAQIVAGGITDSRVIAAMRRVPRHLFISDQKSEEAYGDYPLSIGYEQTISQPFIVAFMTQALNVRVGDTLLEIGTGSGYQAAILAELGVRVCTIEIVEELAMQAKKILAALGYDNVIARTGDGYQGWHEESPFDVVIITAAPDHIPPPLIEQLAMEGRLILPVGEQSQSLVLLQRTTQGLQRTELLPVRFVPMTGQARQPCSE